MVLWGYGLQDFGVNPNPLGIFSRLKKGANQTWVDRASLGSSILNFGLGLETSFMDLFLGPKLPFLGALQICLI